MRIALLVSSLVLACLSLSARWVVHSLATNPAHFVLASALLAVAWLLILMVSVHRYGKGGCWVLVGAPLVLYWPVMLVWAFLGCDIGNAPCARLSRPGASAVELNANVETHVDNQFYTTTPENYYVPVRSSDGQA